MIDLIGLAVVVYIADDRHPVLITGGRLAISDIIDYQHLLAQVAYYKPLGR